MTTKTKLREFESWSDLASNCSEEEILGWVNQFAREREARTFYNKRRQKRLQLVSRVAEELLGEDEWDALTRQAEEQVAAPLQATEAEYKARRVGNELIAPAGVSVKEDEQ